MKRLTPAYRSMYYALRYKSSRLKKASDGSFYYDDKRLADELEISVKTIMRGKKFLSEAGCVRIESGKFKGKATKYWVLEKPDKKSPFQPIEKPDKLSVKPDKLSPKAPQNVTPNKGIIKKENKLFKHNDCKEQIQMLLQVSGKAKTEERLRNSGYQEDQIKEIIKICQNNESDACKSHQS